MNTYREIVSAFGGGSAMARRLGLKPPAVSNWMRDGIPKRWWVPIIEEAQTSGLGRKITLEALWRAEKAHERDRASHQSRRAA
jgi:DNA-binding transcriptional regulator YdaS (Cro superfamily)